MGGGLTGPPVPVEAIELTWLPLPTCSSLQNASYSATAAREATPSQQLPEVYVFL